MLQTSTTYANELSYSFYDKKARPIRTYSTNLLGGYTYTDSKLDFTGKPDYTITYHKRTSGDVELKTKEVYTYSPQGRLLTQTHQIGTGTIELIASNKYDELGQLISKEVGGNIQKIDYTYNIRGWLKGINDVNSIGNDLFAFKINYNDIADVSKKLYNGNISQTLWRTSNTDTSLRDYVYTYDALNRLNNATDNSGKLNETIYYDKNGNITNLTRLGEIVGGSTVPNINNASHFGVMDNLKYTYDTGNKLQIVSDSGNKTYGFKDDHTGSGDDLTIDYTYDINGNMKTDTNKGITDITYSHLNLPTKIIFDTAGNIVYIYNAAGQKVQKVVTQGSIVTTTDYLGGYQYVKINSGTVNLKFFPTAEGYVEPNGSSYKYVYQYKDHLGNVRLSYDKTLAIQEENNYYPFGLKQKGYNTATPSTNDALKYKYQGQERQDELGLNWDSFKYRNYDMAIGRFMSIDPLAEDFQFNSPYAFAENKLGMGIELEGLELWSPWLGGLLSNSSPVTSTPLLGTSDVVKLSTEVGTKASEVAGKATEGSGKFSESTLKDFARGNATEAEQLAKNGLEKNTKPIDAVDPKTGQKGTTIPDGLKGGKTTEVKDVKYQGLTRQLRLQKEFSNGNGLKPELIINQSARLSKPLQNAGFDIKTYGTAGTTIESTGVPKPKIMPIQSTKIEIISILPGIY